MNISSRAMEIVTLDGSKIKRTPLYMLTKHTSTAVPCIKYANKVWEIEECDGVCKIAREFEIPILKR